MQKDITVALAGNPNSGKTTIFNSLTGARQNVGNYPGVTVEFKEGLAKYGDNKIKVVDLPGTYSLTAHSDEEKVARDFIINEKPDYVVDIIDSSNLERNLYLAVQLMELGAPLVLAFNMSDQSEKMGYEFDLGKISGYFNAPVVKTIGHKGKGLDELLELVVSLSPDKGRADNVDSAIKLTYGEEVDRELDRLEQLIKESGFNSERPARWTAIKLLENDEFICKELGRNQILKHLSESAKSIEESTGEKPENIIPAKRYEFISNVCNEAVRSTIEIGNTASDKIDSVLTNRFVGIPIFLGLMYLVFSLTFTVGEPLMGMIESFFGWLSGIISSLWPAGAESALKSLLIDGIIGGVGGVVVFLPNILLLFLAIAILEDTGYMARAAFNMDRLMNKIGLNGKSFIPMLIGFGCTVPAIMATRTLDNKNDRLATMLVLPLMSCGARLPIYALIIPAFFAPGLKAPMLWLLYITGIITAIAAVKILRLTALKSEPVPFLMELPPYRIPTFKSVLIKMWENGWMYLKKAGTIILGISIILWVMTSYPKKTEFNRDYSAELANLNAVSAQMEESEIEEKTAEIEQAKQSEELSYSIAGRVGHFIEPAIKPLGFDWKIGTALVGAFAAKEVFVAQLGIVYSIGEADEESNALRQHLRKAYTQLTAFCIMLFCLISMPCVATVAVTKKESGSWKWALYQVVGLTVLAYVMTLVVYQTGSAFGIGV